MPSQRNELIEMQRVFHTQFVTIFRNEVLLNSQRVAPYAMAILFAANALLWWGWGPAAGRGWATNSDAFIASVLPVFSFLTLPLFTALLMADPVIRDFRTGIAPLIFSKPVSSTQYLLGKFFGNFFVLVCCQAVFVITLFVLQAFRRPGMLILDLRTIPYLKHFVVFVVISHFALGAFYFMVGTLTRNAKIVYGLAIAFYPLYIAYQSVLKNFPVHWRGSLDPLLMNWANKSSLGVSAELANSLVVAYDADLIINRAVMILIAAVCLSILYARFATAERPENLKEFSALNLSTAAEGVYFDSESFKEEGHEMLPSAQAESRETSKNVGSSVGLPAVDRANGGISEYFNKLFGALTVEYRLLRTERSLVVIAPLAVVLSFLSLPFQLAVSTEDYSAAYASNTASGLLLFLLGVIVFHTGEAMHRDRELQVEPVLWSMPAPNGVLLLSKFLTTVSLALALICLAALTAIATQFLRGHTPVEVSAYVVTYAAILFPTILFITSASITLNALGRDKYFTYTASIAIGAGLFYIYNLGHNHWLYNPALYQLWTYADLTGGGSGQRRILMHRIYWLALSCLCLALAHFGFQRQSAKGFRIGGRLGPNGWVLVVMIISTVVAVVTGIVIK